VSAAAGTTPPCVMGRISAMPTTRMGGMDRRAPSPRGRDWTRFWAWLAVFAACLNVWAAVIWLLA
jgi:hypothetical protein